MIRPGFLTVAGARALSRFHQQTEADRKALERRQQGSRLKIPAKLTSTDGQGRFGWVEQSYTSTGGRYDKPGGLYGSAVYSPAYAVGDGTGPLPTALPVQTYLRQVLGQSDRGPVWEFDWHCACVGGYSGSGSGGDLLAPRLDCCNNLRIPRTLFITFVISSGNCSCLDGVSFPIQFDDANLWWEGSTEVSCQGGRTLAVRMACENIGGFVFTLREGTGNECSFNILTPPAQGQTTCGDPFTATWTANLTFAATPSCCNTVSVFGAVVTE